MLDQTSSSESQVAGDSSLQMQNSSIVYHIDHVENLYPNGVK